MGLRSRVPGGSRRPALPRWKFALFSLIPVVSLVAAGEAVVRVKYFFDHGYDWRYLTVFIDYDVRPSDVPVMQVAPPAAAEQPAPPPADEPEAPGDEAASTAPMAGPARQRPAPVGESAATAPVGPAPSAAAAPGSASPPHTAPPAPSPASAPAPAATGPEAGPAAGGPAQATAPEPAPSTARPRVPDQQVVFRWSRPCVNDMVFSAKSQKPMPRRFDRNCFRGDAVAQAKGAGEFRIMFVGGSTVEDALSDEEMMTTEFKAALPPLDAGRTAVVVNAGRAGFESRRIFLYWSSWLHAFAPDLLLYYEGWNEQPTDVHWTKVDARLAAMRGRVHSALYNRSKLYTYLVEKFAFSTTVDRRFWKIDVADIRDHFVPLVEDVRRRGVRMAFVTQVVRFPRTWKGVDTFDYAAVDSLIDRLRADPAYVYDTEEISALNQRLAVLYTMELCAAHDVPVLDILGDVEALGARRRGELFVDLGHLSALGTRTIGELVAKAVVRKGLVPVAGER